jgi:hypothetical protein
MVKASVALFDARPFFEKTLAFGVQERIIQQDKLDAMCTDAPKGMVQIARYFGTEFLRPELEKAKDRMVNLVGLHLEHASGGDLRRAAQLLADNSFLSRSKAGSDMLKSLIAMPQNSHFGMNERSGFKDEHIPLLAKWALRPLADYRAELAKRSAVAQVVDAAVWMADALGMDEQALEDAGKDAEAVIRTALLVHATKRSELPDWVAFDKMLGNIRNTALGKSSKLTLKLPNDLPSEFRPVVESARQSVLADLPKIMASTAPNRKLFDQTPAFIGRYFWVEDALSEVDDYDRKASAAWHKATGGHEDEGSLLTMLLCIAAGAAPKTMLSEKAAAALVRKIRKTGLKPLLASQHLAEHAPEQHKDDYTTLWTDFMRDAQATLQSDSDYKLHDALALLRRECNVAGI